MRFIRKINENQTKSKNEKKVKSYCRLPLYHHVKMNEKYELFSLCILMINKWDSMNKSKTKYKQIMMIEKWYSMNKSKNKYKWS